MDHGGAMAGRALRFPPVGVLQIVAGSVAVKRGDEDLSSSHFDGLIWEGDTIETDADGLALIHFADGSTLQIYGNAELLVDERVHGDEKAQSKRIRLSRGSFQFIARRSSPETILLDTPLAHIRNVRPASLFGSFVFGVLTLALIDELKAASSDLALLDDETITYKDIKHGVFVVVTKEATPRVIVVDDPGELVVIRSNGTAASVEHVPNSLSQMAQIENAYEGVATINAVGKQDPFFQQYQQGGKS